MDLYQSDANDISSTNRFWPVPLKGRAGGRVSRSDEKEKKDRNQEEAKREEYGMRWRGLDREMGLNDKLFFIDGEGEKGYFISILTTSLDGWLSGPVKY